jgi:hypothetical protein
MLISLKAASLSCSAVFVLCFGRFFKTKLEILCRLNHKKSILVKTVAPSLDDWGLLKSMLSGLENLNSRDRGDFNR